jgi:hypothetical protein
MSCAVGGIVAFNWMNWAIRYPELASQIAQPQAQSYFNESQLYVDNTPTSIIRDSSVGGVRDLLLGMVTAHIAALYAPLNGQPASPIVGRINGAAQGSVNVQAQMDVPAGSAQWFNQTRYGASFWAASARYRTMHYVPGRVPIIDPYVSSRGGGWNGF